VARGSPCKKEAQVSIPSNQWRAVTSSAPPWPRDWRIWWDPKAPHGSGSGASQKPTIDPIPPVLPENPPTITGTGKPGCQIWLVIKPGGSSVYATVNPDGTWSFTPDDALPPGDYCVEAKQRCPDPGTWSEAAKECFSVVEVDQTIDFETKGLRFDSVNDWRVQGTIAYKINGTWVHGVLRRAVEVRHG
jgi:hypothetical protein